MNLINFAIDFGNGYVKAKSKNGEFIAPAKIAFESDLGVNTLNDNFDTELNVSLFSRKEDKQSFVFGQDIEKVVLPKDLIDTNASENRYNKKSFQQLVEYSLAELGKCETNNENNTLEVRLVTGMPSNDLSNKDYVNDFREFLQGTHVIMRDNKEFVINVKEVKIIEQPLGTLLNVFLNNDLQVHTDLKEGLIVVIDFGSGTTIVDIYKNMKRIGGDTQQEGMIQFYKDVAEQIRNKKSHNIDTQFIEDGIKHSKEEKGQYLAIYGKQVVDFTQEFNIVLEKKLYKLIQSYESEIGQESIVNDFIITGGGSFIIGDAIKQEKPNFRLINDPQFSTTKGYYKLAQSIGKDD